MMKTDQEMQRFYTECRKHHLKITPQRTVLFKELLSEPDHPTADMVYQRVRETLPNISYDTVNRTLLSFADLGIIRQIESRGTAKRFDPDVSQHHHFQCIKCGRIIDIEDESYNNIGLPKHLPEGLVVLDKHVVLEGICDTCHK